MIQRELVYMKEAVAKAIEKLDAKEIAALPEFEGNEAFIEKMFKRLEKHLETSERVKEEFGQACEIHRTVKE